MLCQNIPYTISRSRLQYAWHASGCDVIKPLTLYGLVRFATLSTSWFIQFTYIIACSNITCYSIVFKVSFLLIIYSFIYSFINAFIHLLTHSLIHSLINSFSSSYPFSATVENIHWVQSLKAVRIKIWVFLPVCISTVESGEFIIWALLSCLYGQPLVVGNKTE